MKNLHGHVSIKTQDARQEPRTKTQDPRPKMADAKKPQEPRTKMADANKDAKRREMQDARTEARTKNQEPSKMRDARCESRQLSVTKPVRAPDGA